VLVAENLTLAIGRRLVVFMLNDSYGVDVPEVGFP
jgi:hypothetical protein